MSPHKTLTFHPPTIPVLIFALIFAKEGVPIITVDTHQLLHGCRLNANLRMKLEREKGKKELV